MEEGATGGNELALGIDAGAKFLERHALIADGNLPVEVGERRGVQHPLGCEPRAPRGGLGRRGRRKHDSRLFDFLQSLGEIEFNSVGGKRRHGGKEEVFPLASRKPRRVLKARAEFREERVGAGEKFNRSAHAVIGIIPMLLPPGDREAAGGLVRVFGLVLNRLFFRPGAGLHVKR